MSQQKKTAIKFPIARIMDILRAAVASWEPPFVSQCALDKPDPFKILISTILSLRTRDEPTRRATEALFALASTPAQMAALPLDQIAAAIRPAMYYQNKARTIRELCERLTTEYGGRVPDEIDELLKFKGVGRKTANLVVTLAHARPGICVDTHVHRIVNRWGYVQTATPAETEAALREKLPAEYWIPINGWLVTFGQQVCVARSPKCSICPLAEFCPRHGVTKFR